MRRLMERVWISESFWGGRPSNQEQSHGTNCNICEKFVKPLRFPGSSDVVVSTTLEKYRHKFRAF